MKDTHPLGSSTDVIIAPKGMVLIVNPFEFFKIVSLIVDIFINFDNEFSYNNYYKYHNCKNLVNC